MQKMQESSSARPSNGRKRTRERSLRRRKPKSLLVCTVNCDPLDLENPESQLTKTNIKNIITDQIFRSFSPRHQSKLAELLPPCDRVLGLDNSMSIGPEALNNEFFAKACLEWRERLADGDFTQETKIRCKLEREKRLHVDDWKKKYFESFWGEKLISSTTGMTVSSPVVNISTQNSVQEKHHLLVDSLTKLKQTLLNSPAAVSKSSQQVKEQLSQMLNSKSLQLPKSNGAALTAVATVTKLPLPDNTGTQLEHCALEKLMENNGTGQMISHSASMDSKTSSGSHLAKKTLKTTFDSALLGKRAMNAEQSLSSCPSKRSLLTLPSSAKSQNNSKSGSAASLMPILANALLKNDLSKTASFSSSIPSVVLLEKPMPSCKITSTLQSQVVGPSSLIQSDSQNASMRNETDVNITALSGNAGLGSKDFVQKLDEISMANNAKKNFSLSDGIGIKHLEHLHKSINVISLQDSDKQPMNISANQLRSSNLNPSSGTAIPLLDALVVSSAPLLCPSSNPTSFGKFVFTPVVGWEKSLESGNCDAFKRVSLNMETVPPKSNSVNPVIISPQESMFIVQQFNPCINIKPLAPHATLPNQIPVFVVLGNSGLPGVTFPSSQVPRLSMTTPELAINNRLTELFFTSRSEPITQSMVAQAQHAVIPSGPLIVADRPLRSPEFKTKTFTCQASPRVIGANPITKTISTVAHTNASFSTRTTSSCGIDFNSSAINRTLQKFLCTDTAFATGPVKLNWQNPIGIDVTSTKPVVVASQQQDRFISSILNTQTSVVTSFENLTQGVLAKHPRNLISLCPNVLTASQPPVPSINADQNPRVLVAVSEATSQIYCAGKNSLGILPVHNQQSKVLMSLGVNDTAVKFVTDPIITLRQANSSVIKPCTSAGVPSVTCCSILPSAVENASAFAQVPLFLVQSPLSKPSPPTSETTVSLSTRLNVSSMLTSNCVSSLITLPSQAPLVFQVVNDGIQTVEPQNIVLNMMPVNGTVALKVRHSDKEQCNQVKHPVCFSSPSIVTSYSITSEAKSIGSNANTINGSKVKTITIKKLISMPQSSSCHLTSSGQQIPIQTRSLIKTLLSVHEPQVVQTVGSSDQLTSAIVINRNIASHTDSSPSQNVLLNAPVLKENDVHDVCNRCGSSLMQNEMRRGEIISNSSSICVACQTFV